MDSKAKESKIIAEIKVNIEDQFTLKDQQIMDYNSCMLCGTELEFTHTTQFIYNEVEETAYCPLCDVQNRKETHKLQ